MYSVAMCKTKTITEEENQTKDAKPTVFWMGWPYRNTLPEPKERHKQTDSVVVKTTISRPSHDQDRRVQRPSQDQDQGRAKLNQDRKQTSVNSTLYNTITIK